MTPIQAVGYTDDQQVFVMIAMIVNNEPSSGRLEMTVENARKFAADIAAAADQAEKGPPQ